MGGIATTPLNLGKDALKSFRSCFRKQMLPSKCRLINANVVFRNGVLGVCIQNLPCTLLSSHQAAFVIDRASGGQAHVPTTARASIDEGGKLKKVAVFA